MPETLRDRALLIVRRMEEERKRDEERRERDHLARKNALHKAAMDYAEVFRETGGAGWASKPLNEAWEELLYQSMAYWSE